MNILIVSPLQTYPTDHGSKKRILELGMYFKKLGYKVNLVYLKHKYEYLSEFTIDKMLEQWDTLSIIHIEKFLEDKMLHYPLDYLYEEHIGEELIKITKKLYIDMVLVNYIYYSKIFEILPNNIVKVLDTIDKFTDRNLMLQDAKIDKNQWWFSITQENETIGLNRADIVLAIQNNEKAFFISICKREVLLINHIEYKNFIKPLKYKDKLIIGFIGSNNHSNISSINSFIEKFIKFIDKNKYDIELNIAGRVCEHIKQNHSNIKKLYFLNDTSEFFKNIHLFINPLTSGTGLKIKSIEALSYGTPIISTKIGFDGIKSKFKFHQIDNLDIMIERLDEIYQNQNILDKLSIKTRNIFEKYKNSIHNNILKVFDYDKFNHIKSKKLSNKFIEKYNISQRYKIKYEALKFSYEINQNRTFSRWLNKLYGQIDSIVEKHNKFILYGFGHSGRIIYYRYKDNIISIIDKNYKFISSQEKNIKIDDIDILNQYNDEFIIIGAMGREDEIYEYLINNYNIDKDKIIKINLSID